METLQLQQQHEREARLPTCPPWFQTAIADIEQRMRSLAESVPDDAAAATDHSFAERDKNYYHRRPQLLALLTDLHHRYLYLADRYSQSLFAKSHPHLNLVNAAVSECSSDVDDRSSDAGRSLSFQPHDRSVPPAVAADSELVVAEMVMAWVGRDMLADEAEQRKAQSERKIQLQGNLIDVLESERLVLLGESARLGSCVSEVEEVAAAATAQLGYTRRLAAEMLGQKIEPLKEQVDGLERDCYETMAAWEAERKASSIEIDRLRNENRRLVAEAQAAREAAAMRRKRCGNGWWRLARVRLARVRLAAEWTPCAPASVTVRKVGKQMKGGNGAVKYNGGCFCL